jgi:hypothetical protein
MNMRASLVYLTVLGCSLAASAAAFAQAEGQKPGDEKAGTEQAAKFESKREQAAPMPDFPKCYRLPFESLKTLGYRLADCRQKCDPIAMALIATEMGIAEKLSGKTAELTSSDVLKESVELCRMRRQEKELSALAMLVKDSALAESLNSLAEKAKSEEAERISKFQSGERDSRPGREEHDACARLGPDQRDTPWVGPGV